MERTRWPSRTILPGSIRYSRSEGSLDHTSIEEFRNRFGTKGAELITKDMMRVAKEFGFTKGDDVDMDSAPQAHKKGVSYVDITSYAEAAFSRMSNPILRGWVQYYGRYSLSAMRPVLRHFNMTLVAWAMRKYKRLKGHKSRAMRLMEKIFKRQPWLFVHWEKRMCNAFA